MSQSAERGTVYVVDDDEAVRDSIRWLLEGHDFHVLAVHSAESFLSHYDRERVSCLLIDVRMDGMSGLELQDHLAERGDVLPMAFITGHGDLPMAVDTMKKGAVDFIQKPFNEEHLIQLVEQMLTHARVQHVEREQAAEREALLATLTTREQQVLERIVAGRLNKQIAIDLGISIKTVEAHRSNVMSKLGANTIADLLRLVLGSSQATA